MKLEAEDVLPNINHTQAGKGGEKFRFFVRGDLDLLTFDLDIQTHPSEGPDMSSL